MVTCGLRREVELARRAIKERWKIPAEVRRKLAARLQEIALNADGDVRAAVAAARALADLDKINLEQEKRDLGIPDRQEISGPGGGPLQVAAGLDLTRLSDDELTTIQQLLDIAAKPVPTLPADAGGTPAARDGGAGPAKPQ